MNETELILLGLSIVISLLIIFGAWPAIKKFIIDLADAIEDDQFTKEEFIRQINDGINIFKIFKHLLGR